MDFNKNLSDTELLPALLHNKTKYTDISSQIIIFSILLYASLNIVLSIKVILEKDENVIKLKSCYQKIKKDKQLISSIIFLSIWLFLACYYFYLFRKSLNLSEFFSRKTMISVLKLFLNAALTLVVIWFLRFASHVSSKKMYITLVIVIVIILMYYILSSYSTSSIYIFIAKVVAFAYALLVLIKYANQIRVYLNKLRKAIADLSNYYEAVLFLNIFTSLAFILQLICISGIIQESNPGILMYIFLIVVFDWSYNFITGCIHTFVVYIVYGFNCSDKTNLHLHKLPYLKAGMEICFKSIKPSVFQLIPSTLVILNQSVENEPSNLLISLFRSLRLMISKFFEFLKSDYDESLTSYAIRKNTESNGYEKVLMLNEPNGILNLIRKWILRITLILITFSFLGLHDNDYFVEYKLFTSIHMPLAFLKSSLENPLISSTSYILSVSIIICTLFSIESSLAANEIFYKESETNKDALLIEIDDNLNIGVFQKVKNLFNSIFNAN